MGVFRAAIVIDYQNLHLTGHYLFPTCSGRPRHKCLIDPLLFGERLMFVWNRAQQQGMAHAVISKILVYRGQPSADFEPRAYAWSNVQREYWERDLRVSVTLRPLRYSMQYTAAGKRAVGPDGRHITTGPPPEKGVDVLCALALVRECRDPRTDLVILASVDSDLQPALDEALTMRTAKIETVSWRLPHARYPQLRPTSPRRVWNTNLNENDFHASRDTTNHQ
ncbi:MAG: hypothetical protein ACRC0L_12330 [Angustibacter sp.]